MTMFRPTQPLPSGAPRQGSPCASPPSPSRHPNRHSLRLPKTRQVGLRKRPITPISTQGVPPLRKGAHTEEFDGMVLTLRSNHYFLSAPLGITPKTMHTRHAVVNAGSIYNVIRMEGLYSGWHGRVIQDAPLPNRGTQTGTHWRPGTSYSCH